MSRALTAPTGPRSRSGAARLARMGVFLMADHRMAASVYWVEPKLRGILPLDAFPPLALAEEGRSSPIAFRVTVDPAFEADSSSSAPTPPADRPDTRITWPDQSASSSSCTAAASRIRSSAGTATSWPAGELGRRLPPGRDGNHRGHASPPAARAAAPNGVPDGRDLPARRPGRGRPPAQPFAERGHPRLGEIAVEVRQARDAQPELLGGADGRGGVPRVVLDDQHPRNVAEALVRPGSARGSAPAGSPARSRRRVGAGKGAVSARCAGPSGPDRPSHHSSGDIHHSGVWYERFRPRAGARRKARHASHWRSLGAPRSCRTGRRGNRDVAIDPAIASSVPALPPPSLARSASRGGIPVNPSRGIGRMAGRVQWSTLSDLALRHPGERGGVPDPELLAVPRGRCRWQDGKPRRRFCPFVAPKH